MTTIGDGKHSIHQNGDGWGWFMAARVLNIMILPLYHYVHAVHWYDYGNNLPKSGYKPYNYDDITNIIYSIKHGIFPYSTGYSH